jgi:hypothetical protein
VLQEGQELLEHKVLQDLLALQEYKDHKEHKARRAL